MSKETYIDEDSIDYIIDKTVYETHTKLAEVFATYGDQLFSGKDISEFILSVRDIFLKKD